LIGEPTVAKSDQPNKRTRITRKEIRRITEEVRKLTRQLKKGTLDRKKLQSGLDKIRKRIVRIPDHFHT